MLERFLPLGHKGREGLIRVEGERASPWLSIALMSSDVSSGPTVQQRVRPSDARRLAEVLLELASLADGQSEVSGG